MIENRHKLLRVKPAQRPLIFGHRGSPLEAQENTLASFELAFAEGADGVELDVRLTADDVPVVFHDDHLPSGERLRDLALADLLRKASQQKIALFTLEIVLAHLKGRGYLDIEIKDADLPPLVAPIAEKMLFADSYVFSSFLPEVIEQFNKFAPNVPTIWIVEKVEDAERTLRTMNEIGAAGIAPWFETIDKPLADFFARAGVPLFTFTVNDSAVARRLAEWGVVGIITDKPGEVWRD